MKIIKIVLLSFLFVTINLAGDNFLIKIKKEKGITFFKSGTDYSTNNEKLKNLIKTKSLKNVKKLNLRYLFQGYEIFELEFENTTSKNELDNLNEFEDVNYLKSDSTIDVVGSPFLYQGNDPFFDSLNALKHMQFNYAWPVEGGNNNVLVAIFDTGLDWYHPDLVENIHINEGEMNINTTVDFVNGIITGDGIDNDGNGYIDDLVGWDFRLDRNDPNHVPGEIEGVHGTQVSGPFSVPDNYYGFVGMAPNVELVGCKVNSSTLNGWVTNSIEAIDYSIGLGVDIINHSYGWYWSDQTIWHQAIQEATNNYSILFIALAHNQNSTVPRYPAGWDEVMAVAATLLDDTKLDISNYGTWVDVSATVEDVGILSFDPSTGTHSTTIWTGATSSASPIGCAVAALVKSIDDNFTPQQIRDIITETADNIDDVNPNYVGLLGTGRINAYQAVLLAQAYSNKSTHYYPGYNNNHLIERGFSGKLHEVFHSGDEIFYRRSSDNGTS